MINLDLDQYVYWEEVNEGIIRNLNTTRAVGQKILDVGCGRGTLGKAVSSHGHIVWGIEQHPSAISLAKNRIHKVICCDLTNFKFIKTELKNEQFDILIFSDVLEHFYNPLSILKFYLSYLKPGGQLMVSLPNIVVWTNRLALLFGNFDYKDTGVTDRTHIRFFTFRTAERLLDAAGLTIIKKDYTPMITRTLLPIIKKAFISKNNLPHEASSIIDSPFYKFYLSWIYPVEHLMFRWRKELFGFRIIFIANKPT